MNTDLQMHSGADTKSVMACFHPKSTNFRNASVGLTTQYGQYGTVFQDSSHYQQNSLQFVCMQVQTMSFKEKHNTKNPQEIMPSPVFKFLCPSSAFALHTQLCEIYLSIFIKKKLSRCLQCLHSLKTLRIYGSEKSILSVFLGTITDIKSYKKPTQSSPILCFSSQIKYM